MGKTALLYGIYQLQGNAGCAIFDGMVMDVSDRIPFVIGDRHIPARNNHLLPGEILPEAVVQSILKSRSCNDFHDPRFRRYIQETYPNQSCTLLPVDSTGIFIHFDYS